MVHVGAKKALVAEGKDSPLDKDNKHDEHRHKKGGQQTVVGPERKRFLFVSDTGWCHMEKCTPLVWFSSRFFLLPGIGILAEDQELAALIAIGYPDIDPDAPKRKSVDDLLTYL